MIICPYTFVLVHMRHNSKQKKGKLIILLMDNLSPGCSLMRGPSQALAFVELKPQVSLYVFHSVVWNLPAAFPFREANCELC